MYLESKKEPYQTRRVMAMGTGGKNCHLFYNFGLFCLVDLETVLVFALEIHGEMPNHAADTSEERHLLDVDIPLHSGKAKNGKMRQRKMWSISHDKSGRKLAKKGNGSPKKYIQQRPALTLE